jgi:sulfur-carrier protein adenylyltransferase/sulfurtransferase
VAPFSFSTHPLDPDELRRSVADPACGGYVSFEGWVRDFNDGRPVRHLEYEAYAELAVKEGDRIIEEAKARFGVPHAVCVHRIGDLALGDLAVWVGVSAPHRGEAFAACRYIIDEVKHRVPIWKKEHYVDGDSGWVNCERCAAPATAEHSHTHHEGHAHHAHGPTPHATPAHPAGLAKPDYSRQTVLADVGTPGQARLRAARVLVIGAGGLGVPVLTYLAGAGVGVLGIIDGDVLEASNLHRQTLYGLNDVGRHKALLAAERLRALNPEVDVRPYALRADAASLPPLASDFDILVDCSDNFATRFIVNDAAVSLGKSAVLASVYQYEGQVQVVTPGSACLRCVWPEATRDGLVGNCAEAGVLGPVPGVLGSLQALEVIKLILGLDSPARNALVLVDLRTLETHRLKTARARDCGTTCAHLESPAETASLEVASLDEARERGLRVIDVREPEESRAQPAPDLHRQIPVASLLEDPTQLSFETGYVLVCTRGIRSRAVAEALRLRGFQNVWSLRGGLG